MGLTKAQLDALNDSSFPNNNGGLITPLVLRDYNDAIIVNTVNQDAYTADSASFNTRINNVTGSATNTGSLLLTASFDNGTRNLTFTKGNATTFAVNIPDASGSATINTGSFATTGSNTFTGQQILSNTGDLQFPLQIISGGIRIDVNDGNDWMIYNGNINGGLKSTGNNLQLLSQTGSLEIHNTAGTITISGLSTLIQNVDFIPFSASLNTRILAATGSGGGTTYINPTLNPYSGSLILVANTFTSSSFAHISASANGQVNLVFKNNNNTADTIISGSNNIFTNPNTPTTGYIRYIGGSNNLYLNSTNGVNSQITASAASVSGNRPVMNNNIFAGVANFVLNYASNAATTQNIISNITAVPAGNSFNINALAHTGSMDIYGNLTMGSDGGITTLNPSSASVAEIALGLSGSGAFIYYNNINNNGTITITSNRNIPAATTTRTTGNIITGGSLTITNISSSANVSAISNINNSGTFIYSNAGAANLALHRNASIINSNYGPLILIASASAISATGNVCTSAPTVTNRMYSGSLGSGSVGFNNNQIQGALNTYTVSGSYGGTAQGTLFAQNAVFGGSNTFFTNVEGRGNYVNFSANGIFGANLILTGSNNTILSENGGAHIGRYNANDGIRNTTGENIFSVGTGTSTTRKTGFLIDSGSNSYFEGTLNVSGSTAMTGSLSIAPTFEVKFATGSNQQAGTAVLDGGTPASVVVSNSLVTANSIIMLTKQTNATPASVSISAKSGGSFTITSTVVTDADTVGWFIINNS